MAASAVKNVDLGFLEKSEDWQLSSHFFPCKVGGKPAWLSLKPLPSLEDVTCGTCGKPCVFLLQIYAPVNEVASCFHRTIFVFICRDPACCKRNDASNVKVLRSQLNRHNEFFSAEPPGESAPGPGDSVPSASDYQPVCEVCGGSGPKRCSKCHTASYCSKQHQTMHWKAGHKQSCGQQQPDPSKACVPNLLFPEQEIIIESEELDSSGPEKSEAERLDEYKEFMSSEAGSATEFKGSGMDKDLENMALSEAQADQTFAKFKKRIAHDPEQVLRYQRGGVPLWVSDEGIAMDTDVPLCKCGAPRQFEFQVLPQLLVHLNVDSLGESLDWGTLVIYTCSKHCDIGNNYNHEFVWKQDFSNRDIGPQQ